MGYLGLWLQDCLQLLDKNKVIMYTRSDFIKTLKPLIEDYLCQKVYEFDYDNECYEHFSFELEVGEFTCDIDATASGYRTIDRGDYYIPPSESINVNIEINSVEVWDEEGEMQDVIADCTELEKFNTQIKD